MGSKIHYRHPEGHPSFNCRHAKDGSEFTDNPEKVTCKMCLQRLGVIPVATRPITKFTTPRTFSITLKATKNLGEIPKGQRSQVVSDFLESLG